MTLLESFLRELKRERTRMALTVLGIAWGTASIALMLALGDSVSNVMTKGTANMGEGIVVVWGAQTVRPFQGMPPGRAVPLSFGDAEAVRSGAPGVGELSGEFTQWGNIVEYGAKSRNLCLCGVDPSYRNLRNFEPMPGGRFLNARDLAERRRVIFLGDDIKAALFGAEEAVGKTVLLNRVPFMVIGVLAHKMELTTYNGMDRQKAVIPSSTFSVLKGTEQIHNLVFRPVSPARAGEAKRQVQDILAGRHRFDPADESALKVWDVAETSDIMGKVLLGLRAFLGLIGGLSLLVAGVGVANIMIVMVQDRTQEIGIRMAVGARPGRVTAQFLAEGLLTVALGGGLGLALSWGLVSLLAWLMRIVPAQEFREYMGDPTLSSGTALVVAAVLGLIGLVAAYVPARRASGIDPVEALRTE